MRKNLLKNPSLDSWIIDPMKRFMQNSSSGGIVLFVSALTAIILSNTSLSEWFNSIWHHQVSIGFDQWGLSKDLHHWINDGLMAIFFFVVGLELKREIIAGELNSLKKSVLPIAAAVGGMVVPAIIYLIFNPTGETQNGWGIPMATDIAFALGILYLLGNRVPVSVKIFLTALAIADDLGAVLVIAFFYTSDINFFSLLIGGIFLLTLAIANLAGIRNTIFYGLIGIGGLWLAFLLSGVHATIAAVLAAFTIPAKININEITFAQKAEKILERLKSSVSKSTINTSEQIRLLSYLRGLSKHAQTPLQRLEHSLQPFVTFVVLPIFALSNAGIKFSGNGISDFFNNTTNGVMLGLLLGKTIGIIGTVMLLVKFKLAQLPNDFTFKHLLAIGFLGGIGFTMSLFISELAFKNHSLVDQAKMGIMGASVIAGLIGYALMHWATKKQA
ncbi:MAG: Na+/H+ antiporter NhaA [Bacteroidales bacterium]|nr:Na+/H+ antiporter NhaA [Bacteroidales bacterium]